MSKTCKTCGLTKVLDDFHIQRKGRLGRRAHCRSCANHTRREYYYANLEEGRRSAREWARRNPEYVKARNAKFNAKYAADQRYIQANRERVRQWAKENPEKVREHSRRYVARRRARIREQGVEPYTELEIYERDRWACQLCDQPIDTKCAWPDPMAPSIDHVVPISKGGSDTPRNVQAVHLSCNWLKGNRGLTQRLGDIMGKRIVL